MKLTKHEFSNILAHGTTSYKDYQACSKLFDKAEKYNELYVANSFTMRELIEKTHKENKELKETLDEIKEISGHHAHQYCTFSFCKVHKKIHKLLAEIKDGD